MFLAAARWVDPPLPRPPSPPPLANNSWLEMAGPKSRKMKKKRPHLGSLGVQAIPF